MTPRLFAMIASMEARKLMSYRADFWVSTFLVFLIQVIVAYFLWQAMFAESEADTIGGYTFPGMMVYYILVALSVKLVLGPAGFSGFFSQEIYEGTLNRYLVYPADYFTFKYAQNLGALFPVFVQATITFSALLLIIDLPEDIRITPLTVAMALVSLLVANMIAFLLFTPFELVAFWADNVWSLNVLTRLVIAVLGGIMFPLTLLPLWAQDISAWLPFAYTFHVPVNVLLGRMDAGEWLAGLARGGIWVMLLSALALAIWRRGLKQYTGVGI